MPPAPDFATASSVGRLGFPLFLASLVLLLASLANLLWGNFHGAPLLTYLHEETPSERAARETDSLHRTQLYASRLRDDGLARLATFDYENARTRLDQAAQLAPETNGDPAVIAARKAIAAAPTLDETEPR